MRLAILSDIHGNPLALDAVLADIQSQGEVDAYWVLGDFAALGYDPVTLLETITTLPHASFTRGNTDGCVRTENAGANTMLLDTHAPACVCYATSTRVFKASHR